MLKFNRSLITLFCLFTALPLSAEHRRDQVRVFTPDDMSLRSALSIGLDVVRARPGAYVEVLASSGDMEAIRSSGLGFTIVQQDIGHLQAEKSRMSPGQTQGFGDGSLGGYYTLDETIAILDSLITNDVHGIFDGLDTVGTSHNGRPIVMFTMSDNASLNEGEPEALFNALHHAREPMGLMSLLWFVEHLADNYGTSPEVTYLLDNRKLWFVPVVNPDGYAINESIYVTTSDFGYWRKNARDNNANGYIDDGDGVDLNRNYGYMWGYDNVGSSPNPGSGSYRGPSAFSEPETQVLRDLCESRSFLSALNYHCYSDFLLFPWGYIDAETPDSLIFREMGDYLSELNNYQFGTGMQTLQYFTNGGANDWMYGEQTTKDKMISMTVEVGNYEDYFWPPQERIIPLAEENLYQNIFSAYAAGFHVMFTDHFQIDDSSGDDDGYPDAGEDVDIILNLKNVGLSQAAEGITGELSTESSAVTVTKSTSVFGDAQVQEELDNSLDAFTVHIADPITPGEIATLYVAISAADGYVNTDSFDIILGTPDVIFSDGAESGMVSFDSGSWDISSQFASEGIFSFTDSPAGNYPRDATSIMTSLIPVDLSGATNAYLVFDSRWEIEKDWDIGQVEFSRNGTEWVAMEGTRTFPGSGFTPYHQTDEEGYQSRQVVFVEERMDLNEFTGPGNEMVLFRFVLRSDSGTELDGWYVDAVKILRYGTSSGVENEPGSGGIPTAFGLSQNFPNPFNPMTTISFDVPGTGETRVPATLRIYDVRGRLVRVLMNRPLAPGRHKVTWNGENGQGEKVGSGIFLYTFESGGSTVSRKMVLLK